MPGALNWRHLTLGELAVAGIDLRIETHHGVVVVQGNRTVEGFPPLTIEFTVSRRRADEVGRALAVVEGIGIVAWDLIHRGPRAPDR